MATRKIFGSFVLFCVFCITQVLSQGMNMWCASRGVVDVVQLSLVTVGNIARLRSHGNG